MANSEWIHVSKRKPRPEECGPNGRIIVWHRYNGAMITNVPQLEENHSTEWWMPYPKPPEGAAHLILEEIEGPKGRA